MHTELFLALSDPTRRRILAALRNREQTVNDIVKLAGIHQSGVSRHLGILARAGFVQARVDGAHRVYSLRPAPFRQLAAWMARYRATWERREVKRKDRRTKAR